MRNGRHRPRRSGRIVNHVPNRSIWNRQVFGGSIHSHSDRASAPQRAAYAATNAGHAEVVAQNWNAGFAHAANNCSDLFDLLRTLWTIQKNVMPVRGVEILDGGENQARL